MSKLDDLDKSLRDIKADVPAGRPNLSLSEKQALLQRLGRHRLRDVVKAGKELPKSRIFFLFNSTDSQDIADVLANTWDDV